MHVGALKNFEASVTGSCRICRISYASTTHKIWSLRSLAPLTVSGSGNTQLRIRFLQLLQLQGCLLCLIDIPQAFAPGALVLLEMQGPIARLCWQLGPVGQDHACISNTLMLLAQATLLALQHRVLQVASASIVNFFVKGSGSLNYLNHRLFQRQASSLLFLKR